MSRQYHNIILSLVIMASALVASCGAGNVSMTEPGEDAAGVIAAGGSQDLKEPYLPPDRDALSLEPQGADYQMPQDVDPGMPGFEHLIKVVSGDNEILPEDFYAKSSNTALIDHHGFHLDGDLLVADPDKALDLKSSAGEMAFAEFGLKNIPEGQGISGISFDVEGTEHGDGPHGIYVGVGDYGEGSFHWYDALSLEDGMKNIDAEGMHSTNFHQHAYFVIAVYAGDAALIKRVIVTIGDSVFSVVPKIELDPGVLDKVI